MNYDLLIIANTFSFCLALGISFEPVKEEDDEYDSAIKEKKQLEHFEEKNT